ncbi:MAG: hypothetical protein NC299_15805 [Lachnospiraceae bacterium]|nr:hypothetical protein [Ruminococcus sp.]MCM1276799.1 hypothetical protein [Lachnospiraceae bacterium]
MRRVISLLMCLLMCFALPVTANAQTVQTSIVQPYYEKASNATSDVSISGTTAICRSTTKGTSDVTKIVVEQTLQKQGFLWIWSTYDNTEWTKTAYSDTFTMSNTKTGLSSGKYRLKTVFTLMDKNGKTETITVYSDEKSV